MSYGSWVQGFSVHTNTSEPKAAWQAHPGLWDIVKSGVSGDEVIIEGHPIAATFSSSQDENGPAQDAQAAGWGGWLCPLAFP